MRKSALPWVAVLLFGPLAARAADEPREWELGVGLLGLVGGSFISDLEDRDKVLDIQIDDRTRSNVQFPYPGFAGVGGGGGLAVTGSWRGILALEVDLLYAVERAKGDINDVDIEIAQAALHVPILFRAQIPAGAVRPFVMAGPEIVVPLDAEVELEVSPLPVGVPGEGAFFPTTAEGAADTYVAFAFGLGFEFRLPVPDADLRIPFTLRGAYHGVGDKGGDRQSVTCTTTPNRQCTVELKTEWEWQAAATLGLSYYFL